MPDIFLYAQPTVGDASTDVRLRDPTTTSANAYTVVASGTAYTESVTAASLLKGSLLTASGTTYSESVTAANLLKGSRVIATGATYSESTTAATLLWVHIFTASGAIYTESVTAANLLKGSRVTASSAAYSESVTAASLLWKHVTVASNSTIVVSGTVASLKKDSKITALASTVLIPGTAATLTGSAVGNAYRLKADSDVVTLNLYIANYKRTYPPGPLPYQGSNIQAAAPRHKDLKGRPRVYYPRRFTNS